MALQTLGCLLAGVALFSASAQTTYNLTGTGAAINWNDPSQWNPISGTGTTFPNGIGDVAQRSTANSFTVTTSAPVTVGTIAITNAASSNGTFAAGAGGIITLNNGGAANSTGTLGALLLNSGTSASNARFVLSGTVALADNLNVTNLNTLGNNTSGSFQLSATITGTGNITFRNALNSAATGFIALSTRTSTFTGTSTIASGLVALTGSGTTASASPFGVGNTVVLGASGTASASLVTLLNTGAITTSNNITVAAGNTGSLVLGAVNSSTANSANVTTWSGTVTLNSNLILLSTVTGTSPSFTNTLVLSNVIAGAGNLTVTGSASNTPAFAALGTTNLTGVNTFTGTTRVSSGILALGAAGTGTNSLALQNSTLDLNAADVGSVVFGTSATSAITSATVGGLKGSRNLALVNTNGTPAAVTLSIGNNNSDTTYSGVLSGAGGIRKIGSGALTLSGSNTYSGATVVTAGTLLVDGSVNNSDVSVSGGGTLGGSGRIAPNSAGGLSVSSGGAVAPGDGGIGTLEINLGSTTGSASFLSGSTFTFDLNAPGTSDILSFTGLNASSGEVAFNGNTVNFNNLGSLAAGTYTLFTFDAATDYTGTLTVGTGLGTFSGTFVYNSNSIQLSVVPEPSTAALALGSLFGLFWLRRKKSRVVSL